MHSGTGGMVGIRIGINVPLAVVAAYCCNFPAFVRRVSEDVRTSIGREHGQTTVHRQFLALIDIEIRTYISKREGAEYHTKAYHYTV